jgi:putative transposase
MPVRNIVKQYASNTYYHVYSRGVAKQKVFLDEDDFAVFLGILRRYLSTVERSQQINRVAYRNYTNDIDLACFCLMSNHIHMVIYQKDDERAMTSFMRSVMTSYSMYFNKKYKRVGPVFQSRYLASRIADDVYLQHISRYIHLNPSDWRTYSFSSLPYYTGEKFADWVKPGLVLEVAGGKQKYLTFVEDHEEYKHEVDELMYELADD